LLEQTGCRPEVAGWMMGRTCTAYGGGIGLLEFSTKGRSLLTSIVAVLSALTKTQKVFKFFLFS
jgi:hypothetical protein